MGIAGADQVVSPFIVIRSAGEMASGIALRLFGANMRRICMLDLDNPLCVRREVSFCEAFRLGCKRVEGVHACPARDWGEVTTTWDRGAVAVVRTADWAAIEAPAADVMIDAILAKRNLATRKGDARLVIALGPGFVAGVDCHLVIETNRGHDLGRVISAGSAHPNTGIPGEIAGHAADRVLRAPAAGTFESSLAIGDRIRRNDVFGYVAGQPVNARLDGIVRGLILPGTHVTSGVKLGDIDPRGTPGHCYTVSDKARAIGGAVLESVMQTFNRVWRV